MTEQGLMALVAGCVWFVIYAGGLMWVWYGNRKRTRELRAEFLRRGRLPYYEMK